ncbi:MAG: hypothetical protein QW035_01565 [Candidatus Anstonellales archaeon]
MVLCIVAFVVAAFLSLFSMRYREIAKEALDCSLRMMTLRKCEGTAENKLRAAVFSSISKYNKGLAAFVFANFPVLSLLFTLLLIASSAYALYSIMNLIVYGTCDPNSGSCLFNIMKNQTECNNATLLISGM